MSPQPRKLSGNILDDMKNEVETGSPKGDCQLITDADIRRQYETVQDKSAEP